MNEYREGNPWCYFHPRELVVGICALCLKERLLVLATKQGRLPMPKNNSSSHHRSFRVFAKKPSITIPKVFALSSFLHRPPESKRKPDDTDDDESIPSLDDSFISIKFENDSRASWDRKTAATATAAARPDQESSSRTIVEHAKARGTLRWKKRIGHVLLQVLRWKRSSKPSSCHAGGVAAAGKAEVVKGRRGWIRSLTRRRTTANEA